MRRILMAIKDFPYEVKFFLQRVFRRGHYSDRDVWSLDGYLARKTLPVLRAFRNQDMVGTPFDFIEWEENCGMTKEEYDEKISSGDMIGGGQDAWLKTIDEMLFAFEYYVYGEDMDRRGNMTKKALAFYDRWGIQNPWEPTPETYDKKYEHRGCYHNWDMEGEYAKRAKNGFELFGKYYMSLWD